MSWPKPNKWGVYVPGENPSTEALICDRGAAQGKTRRLAMAPVAVVYLVQTGPDEWRSAHNVHTSHGDCRGGGSFPAKSDPAYPTRSAALAHELDEIVKWAEKLIADCDREEQRFRRDQAEHKAGKRSWVADRNNTPEQRKEAELALAWANATVDCFDFDQVGYTPAPGKWTPAEIKAARDLADEPDTMDDWLENAQPQDLLDWIGGLINSELDMLKHARNQEERDQAEANLDQIKAHLEEVLDQRPALAATLGPTQLELAL